MKKETKKKLEIIGFTGLVTPPVILYLIFITAFFKVGITDGIMQGNTDCMVIGLGGGSTFLLFLIFAVWICIRTELDMQKFSSKKGES